MEQLPIQIETRIDPMTCPHREPTTMDGIDRCMKNFGVFVNCTKSVCGQPPSCAWEPINNSAEAVARRLQWMREHE